MTGWSRRLRGVGTEPDPRFTFANERTFLAWIRTALALVAAGIGLETFAPPGTAPALRQILAALLVLAGALVSATAFGRWLRGERALRRAEPLPPPRLAPLIAYGVAAASVAALVLVIVSRG